MQERQEWMTTEEVAAALRVHIKTVRLWVREGRLRAVDLGSRKAGFRIRREDFDAFLAQRTKGGER